MSISIKTLSNNEYEVTTVVDGNSYTITHTSNASGTASSQGGSCLLYTSDAADE